MRRVFVSRLLKQIRGPKSRRGCQASFAVGTTLGSLSFVAPVQAQPTATPQTYTWNSGTSTAWFTPGNWNGGEPGKFPGVGGSTSNTSQGNAGDIALLSNATANATLGINFNNSAAGSSNSLSVGAISVTANASFSILTSTSLDLDGILRLNGAYAGNPQGLATNVLISLSSTGTAGNLTIGNAAAVATGNIGIRLGRTNGVLSVVTGRLLTLSTNISEDLAGSSLTIQDGGRVVLAGTNTFTGGVFINGGPINSGSGTTGNAAVIANNTSAFGTGAVTIAAVNNLRALEFNVGSATSLGTITNAIVLPNLVGTIGIQGGNSTTNVNLSGLISGGNANLTLNVDNGVSAGLGTIRLVNASNSFRGNITLNRGNLAITSDTVLGNVNNALNLSIGAVVGGTTRGLRFDADNIVLNRSITVSGSSYILVNGDNNGDGITEAFNNVTISGPIASNNAIVLMYAGGGFVAGNSVGSVRLTGTNTLFGPVMVLQDVKLIAASTRALGATTAAIDPYSIADGATLGFDGGLTFTGGAARLISVSGSGVRVNSVGVGAIENISGVNTFNGRFNLVGNTTFGATAGSLTLGGNVTHLSNVSFGFSKIGAGNLTLGGTNLYSGDTSIANGTLVLANPSALGGSGLGGVNAGIANVAITGPGTLDLNGQGILNKVISLSGSPATAALINSSANEVVLGNGIAGIVLTNSGTGYTSQPSISVTGDGSGVMATALLGVSSIAVTANGTGYINGTGNSAVTLSAPSSGNTATGIATVSGNALVSIQVTNPGFGYSTAPTVTIGNGTGATTNVNLQLFGVSIATPGSGFTALPTVSITGGGGSGATGTAVLSGISLLTTSGIGGTGNITAFSPISGSGGLVKLGSGRLTLAGSNTYLGNTTVALGTLTVASAFGLPASGNVVLAGGTLATAGVSSGAALGNLGVTASSNLTFAAGDHTLLFTSLDPTSTGALTISGWIGSAGSSGTGGKLVFTALSGLPTDPNVTYASFLSTANFVGFDPGSMFITSGGGSYELVAAVPEPVSVLTIASVSLGFVMWRRRSGRRLSAPDAIAPAS